ncbi:unnamed protein product [Urochloa humidicola]
MSVPLAPTRGEGDSAGDSPALDAAATAVYPRLFSSLPPLLPLPTHLLPLFTPLGDTVPLPVLPRHERRRRSNTPLKHRAAVRGRNSPPTPSSTTPATRSAPLLIFHTSTTKGPAVQRHQHPWTPAFPDRPGVPFCNYVMEHFHLLAVPVPISRAPLDAMIWIIRSGHGSSPSLVQVRNALNFCFSFPPHLFEVQNAGDDVFVTAVSSSNLARYMVAQGRCRLGTASYLLFPSLGSAIAVSKLRAQNSASDVIQRAADDSVDFKIQTSARFDWAGSTSGCSGPTPVPTPDSLGTEPIGAGLAAFPPLSSVIHPAKSVHRSGAIDVAGSPSLPVTSDSTDLRCFTCNRAHSPLSSAPSTEAHSPRRTAPNCRAPNGGHFNIPANPATLSNAELSSLAPSPPHAEFSCNTPNGSPLRTQPTTTEPRGSQHQHQLPGTARPYLDALLSPAAAPIKMATRNKTRRSRSQLPQTQCFKCLSTDHLIAACRDPVRCRSCLHYGHRSSACAMVGSFSRALWPRSSRRSMPIEDLGSGGSTPWLGVAATDDAAARRGRPSLLQSPWSRKLFPRSGFAGSAAPRGACHALGSVLYPTAPLWTFVSGACTALARALSLSGVPRIVVRDLPTPDRPCTPLTPVLLSDSDEITSARLQPRSVLPSLSDLLEEEEHEVSLRKKRARRKRAADSVSKIRRSRRLAAKEVPFYEDATSKASRIKEAKLDMSKASATMKEAIEKSGILARPAPKKVPPKKLRCLGRVCGLAHLSEVEDEVTASA